MQHRVIQLVELDSNFEAFKKEFDTYPILEGDLNEDHIWDSYKEVLPYISKYTNLFRALTPETKEIITEMRFRYQEEVNESLKKEISELKYMFGSE